MSDERASEALARQSRPESTLRERQIVAAAIFFATFVMLLLTAPKGITSSHTQFNHFALQADAWLKGRLDLGGPPPDYAQNNDFAVFDGKTFISFPPFPALLLVPLVALSGGAKNVADGFVFLVVAACAPAILFLAFERMRRARLSARSRNQHIVLALLLPFATVFWFSAVQGTVWFAAHAVGVTLFAGYLWASIDAEQPALAGLCLALGFATRTPLALALPIFVQQLVFVARAPEAKGRRVLGLALGEIERRMLRFLLPIAIVLVALGTHNAARFGSVFEFGHRYLDVVWQPRIQKWGLFSAHYLGKNLGVALGSTPFLERAAAPFQITGHGLALWITSPFLVFALWPRTMPRRARGLFAALALSAAAIAVLDLSYHNTGWVQFGYRFSNDYIVALLAMLALGRRRLSVTFAGLAAWSVIVNLFGALSFQRPGYEKYYRRERPTTYFEPD